MLKRRNFIDHYTLSPLPTPPTPDESSNRFSVKDWLFLLLPFLLVGALALYLTWGTPKAAPVTEAQAAPVDVPESKAFTIDKYLVPKAGTIQIVASNGSDEAVTIPQVIADDAFWDFDVTPSTLVSPGGVVTFTVPYPWVAGELPEVRLITSKGETIDSEVEPTIESSGEPSATTSSK